MAEEEKDSRPSLREQQEAPEEAEPQRRPWNTRNEAETGRLAEELAERLQNASTVLLDRLFEYLSKLPAEDSTSTEPPMGLTLPASAIGWLSTQLYPQVDSLEEDEEEDRANDHALWMGSSMRDRLALLKFLLPRVTHVRVTSEEWPPSRPVKNTLSSNNRNFVGQEVDADAMSVHSGLTLESIVPPRPSLRSFLYQYCLLHNRPRVDLQLFPSLRVLLLERIPPEWVVNIHSVRGSLELLRTEQGSIYNLSDLLFPLEKEEAGEMPVFHKLTHVKLSHCAIGELSGLRGTVLSGNNDNNDDEKDSMGLSPAPHAPLEVPPPLSRLPNLLSLSLAHNDLRSARTALAGLKSCVNLRRLDLSFNFLTNMRGAYSMLGNVKVLILTGNRIRTVQGLDRLYSLERLYLDKNKLPDLASVAGLANLPELQKLKLSGNPISESNPKRYRVDVFNLFRERRFVGFPPDATYRQLLGVLPLLDGRKASNAELVGLRGFAFAQTVALSEREAQVDLETSPLPVVPSNDEFKAVSTPASEMTRSKRVGRRGKPRKVIIEDGPAKPLVMLSPTIDDGSTGRPKDDSDISRNVHFSLTDVIATLPKLTLLELEEADDSMEPSLVEDGHIQGFAESGDSMMNGKSVSLELYSPPYLRNHEMADEGKGLSFISLSPVKKVESVPGSSMLERDVAPFVDFDESQSNPQSPGRIADEAGSLAMQSRASETDGIAAENGEKQAAKSENSVDEKSQASPASEQDGNSGEKAEATRADKFDVVSPLPMPNVAFPEDVWDDDTSALSSVKTETVDAAASNSKYQAAEEASAYDGPDNLKGLPVSVNLELYFRGFVFFRNYDGPLKDDASDDDKSKLLLNVAPRIQLRPIDWRTLESKTRTLSSAEMFTTLERFARVWREDALACGKLAAKRLTPHRKPKRDFHGQVLFSNGKLEKSCEHRSLILCTSDVAIYFISDFDAVTRHQLSKSSKSSKRRFPTPMPEESLFENAPWPHALSRHLLSTLDRITIGFGFQRLMLHFRPAEGSTAKSSDEFAYILLTGNKLKTISVLQHLQSLSKDLGSRGTTNLVGEALKIDNDDKQVLDALSAAVAPTVVGVVIHYQIVQQRWQHGDRGTVRRSCIVTDTHIFLLSEDYVGDGSESFEAGARQLGEVCFKMVDSAEIEQVSEVQAGHDDPNSVTVIVRPLSRLQRYHRWRLVCHDREGAERLVEDLRKVIPIVS